MGSLNLLEKIDYKISHFIQDHIRNEKLGWVLSRVNRGEVFFIILILILWNFFSSDASKIIRSLMTCGVFAFITDRSVLIIKKIISRKRPLISVSGNKDKNPDMRHSFPSAHAANSMVVVLVLIYGFEQSFAMLIFPFFAGIGRLLTLHHYLSDVIGGWIIGVFFGGCFLLLLQLFPNLFFL